VRRETSPPRPDWQNIIAGQGLVFGVPSAYPDGTPRPYWDESAHYVFDTEEVRALKTDVTRLHALCLEAVEHVVSEGRFAEYGLPEWVWPHIVRSWRRRDPYVLGRFDLCYDGSGPAKLLEYNADTPTSLLESSVVQWHWVTDVFPGDDQWNSLHEGLVQRWKEIGPSLPPHPVHFAWSRAERSGEDHLNAAYLQQTATESGLITRSIPVEDIRWDSGGHGFVDGEGTPLFTVSKLYPWEWIVLKDSGGRDIVESLPERPWVEPLWKMLLSNKTLLAILWEMYPGHPNLLPAFLETPRDLGEYVVKPRLGREGSNIRIVAPGHETVTGGVYGEEGFVYQEFRSLPEFDGLRPVLGAWTVGESPVGLGVRETVGLITDNKSTFVPHRVIRS
jgi:glutathionylspermidine synthase